MAESIYVKPLTDAELEDLAQLAAEQRFRGHILEMRTHLLFMQKLEEFDPAKPAA